ncbi:phospholipid carrier-dependent glycosyltransferase [Candidatus Villigracilis saccharophilus]|uniref:ArnT family glycosyltransferase n=1 Tax=Candidatus Villigracilis saccharophilus TaxID=3140684 RepID=UPI0031EF821A
MKHFLKSHFLFLAVLSLIAVIAVWAVLYSTPQGLGLSDDSIAYIAGARSILSGQGYREAWLASNQPVTHFPPAFSSILALIGLSGLDPLRGTRFVNSLLFGGNAFLLGILGWRMTKSQSAGVVLALLFAVNASFLNAHAVAMSEPLYIFFSLASFLVFFQYFNTKQNSWLVLTGIFVAFAYLTRYAGLALIATFLVALILLQDTWKQKLTSAGIFIFSALPFLLGWSIRNKLVADNATNRTLIWHPLTIENINTAIFNFSEFFIPVETWRRALIKIPNFFVTLLSLIALVLLVWLLYKGLKKFLDPAAERPEILSFTSGLYIFGYLASIVSSMLLFDASTKFKLRILAPVYVSLIILLVFLGYWLWQRRAMIWRSIVIISTFIILALSFNDIAGLAAKLHKGGQGYASFQWYDSQAMDFLDTLPEGTRIYTNQPGPVYLYTDRPSYVLPDLVDPVTDLPREGYVEGVDALQEDVLSGDAALALFKFGSEEEDVQSIYIQLADGLYLAHNTHGDKIYTAFP